MSEISKKKKAAKAAGNPVAKTVAVTMTPREWQDMARFKAEFAGALPDEAAAIDVVITREETIARLPGASSVRRFGSWYIGQEDNGSPESQAASAGLLKGLLWGAENLSSGILGRDLATKLEHLLGVVKGANVTALFGHPVDDLLIAIELLK